MTKDIPESRTLTDDIKKGEGEHKVTCRNQICPARSGLITCKDSPIEDGKESSLDLLSV